MIYMIFAGDQYYPEGPGDFQKAFRSLEEAREFGATVKGDWRVIYTFDPATLAFSFGEWL